jgi:hypothetical protein
LVLERKGESLTQTRFAFEKEGFFHTFSESEYSAFSCFLAGGCEAIFGQELVSERGLWSAFAGASHGAAVEDSAAGQPTEESPLCGREADFDPATTDGTLAGEEDKSEESGNGGVDGVAETEGIMQGILWQPLPEPYEGDLGEDDFGGRGVERAAVRRRGVDDSLLACGVKELGMGFEGRRNQNMGEAVLGASIEGEGVACIEAHGLASASDGDVDGGVVVGGEAADPGGDRIGCGVVFVDCADIREGESGRVGEGMNVRIAESDVAEVVFAAEAREPA